jgi:hypothetical protein
MECPMKAYILARVAVPLAVLVMAGCTKDEALRAAIADLNRNTQAISNLLLEQEKMIKGKTPPAAVQSEVVQADPYLKAIRARCSDANKIEPNPFMRFIYYYFSDSNLKPRGLSSSCLFYTELSGRVSSQLMFNSGRYYAGNGDRERAEQVLRDLAARSGEKTYATEAGQAKLLLDDFSSWDSFSPGWKAYVLGDYATAVTEYKASDDPRAMYKVAAMYEKGEGSAQDWTQAVAWYRKAADQGFAPALYKMGMLYATGNGVSQDKDEAAKWLTKAADAGYQPAKEALGSLGRGR